MGCPKDSSFCELRHGILPPLREKAEGWGDFDLSGASRCAGGSKRRSSRLAIASVADQELLVQGEVLLDPNDPSERTGREMEMLRNRHRTCCTGSERGLSRRRPL